MMSREMKDSGIEWIGEIPKGWEIMRFKYSGSFVKGKLPDETNLEGFGMPIIGATEMNKRIYKTYTLDENVPTCASTDVLILWDGANAGLIANNLEGVVSSTVVKYTCQNENFINQFVFYLLKCSEKYFREKVNGTTIPHMNSKYIDDIPMLLPTLSEQQKIANHLDTKCIEIDNLISLQEEMIAELKVYKQSVITEAVCKGLDKNVPMKDSGVEWIGDIPEHWDICRLKDVLSTKDPMRVGPFGSALKGNDFIGEGYWVYNQRTVLDNNFISNDTFISEDKYNELSGFQVEENDVLITTRGSIGKISLVPKDYKKGVIHPCIIKFRINDNLYFYPLMEKIFNSTDLIMKQLSKMSNSTTIDVVYSYNLKNVILLLIPLSEQQAIASYLDKKCANIDQLISIKQQKAIELKEYKKSLIYEYVTGKKEVI